MNKEKNVRLNEENAVKYLIDELNWILALIIKLNTDTDNELYTYSFEELENSLKKELDILTDFVNIEQASSMRKSMDIVDEENSNQKVGREIEYEFKDINIDFAGSK